MAQWKASRSDEVRMVVEPARGGTECQGDRELRETFRSWKRDGGEVTVTRGSATGFEKRRKRTSGVSSGKKSLVSDNRTALATPEPRPVRRPDPVPPQKSLRRRLREASADVRELRIAAAMSRPRDFAELAPVVEDSEGRLAILGLDFGTAFTKAVVRWSGRHYAVDWSYVVEGEDHHLLASVFSEA